MSEKREKRWRFLNFEEEVHAQKNISQNSDRVKRGR
jgi:hypothetical protein